MINLLIKELAMNGVSFENGMLIYHNERSSFSEVFNLLDGRIKKNDKLVKKIYKDLLVDLQNPVAGDSDRQVKRVFSHAVLSLYDISLDAKCPLPIMKAIKNIVNSDSGKFSSKFMLKIVDFNLGLQWLIHLIRKDMYIMSTMKKYIEHSKRKRRTFAKGFGGPWGRLDLPMEERVFEWGDVAEETSGRQSDKMDQSRYRMGLDNVKDNSPNEGYYWREIRNEPYLFDDKDGNPYPHRDLLWNS